jgi:hypothetical protein
VSVHDVSAKRTTARTNLEPPGDVLANQVDANPETTNQPKARARRWPFLKVPRYSMPDRAGAMVRLDTGQGES